MSDPIEKEPSALERLTHPKIDDDQSGKIAGTRDPQKIAIDRAKILSAGGSYEQAEEAGRLADPLANKNFHAQIIEAGKGETSPKPKTRIPPTFKGEDPNLGGWGGKGIIGVDSKEKPNLDQLGSPWKNPNDTLYPPDLNKLGSWSGKEAYDRDRQRKPKPPRRKMRPPSS